MAAWSQSCVANLECIAVLNTVDYHGNPRNSGGDPIIAKISQLGTEPPLELESSVEDRGNGSYFIKFRPPNAGRYDIKVNVVDRAVKNSPMTVDVSEHNNPVKTYGSRGNGKDQFMQPVAVAYDEVSNSVYVVDTGNCRVKMLTTELDLIKHIETGGLEGRSCTGISCYSNGDDPWFVTVNWRSQQVTRSSLKGEIISNFGFPSFQEPIDIAVDTVYGHILIADNGPCCVFVFDMEGNHLFQVGKKGSQKGSFNLISSVAVGPNSEIIVADSRIQVFSPKGDFLHEIFSEGKGKGRYGGIDVDSNGWIVGSRSEKGRNFLQVFDINSGRLLSTIDSHDSKLKRPSGVATLPDNHVVVVDLGNDCIKKYRYW